MIVWSYQIVSIINTEDLSNEYHLDQSTKTFTFFATS